MSDEGLRKLLRYSAIVLKQGAFAVEDLREIQMLRKELDHQQTEIFDYNTNKAMYDVSLALKQLSRRKFQGKENIDNFVTVLGAGVSCWQAYEDRKGTKREDREMKNLAKKILEKVREYADSVGATHRISDKEYASKDRIVKYMRLHKWRIIIYDSARGLVALKMPE